MFLTVAETIVGSPVCCCAGIILWSLSWCCRNHCWFACVVVWVLFCGVFLSVAETIVGSPVLLCWYCFVECFLVLQKPLLVRLCCYVGIVLWSVS